MDTSTMVLTIILCLIAVGLFVASFFQFKEKGFLFNNAYIYASKEERDQMNKKPYYKQTAIIFLMLGMTFVIYAIGAVLRYGWVFITSNIWLAIVVVYAIVSSIRIEREKK